MIATLKRNGTLEIVSTSEIEIFALARWYESWRTQDGNAGLVVRFADQVRIIEPMTGDEQDANGEIR